MPRLGLRTKLLIGFVIVLLPMLALIVYDYSLTYEQRSRDVIDNQWRTSQAIGAMVEASIDGAFAMAWAFSKDPILRTMDYRQVDPYLQSMASSLPQYDDIAVLDLEGTGVGIMAPRPPGAPRPSGADRPYFLAVKSTRRPAVSSVLISRASGNPTVLVAVPMLDESGTLTGVTLAALDLNYLSQQLSTVDVRASQAIFLTDPEGTLAFHTRLPREEWGRRSLADLPPVQSALGGVPGREREMRGATGDIRMVATTRTARYGWVVGVSVPTAEVLQPVQADLARRLLLFVAVLIFAGLVAVVMSRQLILRPLDVLMGHLLAFGRGQLGQRVTLRTGDEMELVARTFNTMADQLQQTSAEREKLLEETARRADELNAVIGNMAEGVAITDSEGRMLRVNRAGREILGLPTDESVPAKVEQFREADVLGPDGRPWPKEEWPISRALRGETFAEQELVYTRPDSRRINMLFAGSAVRDDEGKVVLGVNVFRDITRMRELERQREEFISVVAHDLRNAIAIVGGYAGLLRRLPPASHNTPQEQRAVESIHNSVRRLERMVLDLLDVSRIEACRLTLVKRAIDLASLVREIVQRSGELTKGHPVRVEVRGETGPVEADPDRIEQVLCNLLSNAGKYSYPDTEITVEVEPLPGAVRVSVTNLGAGIPPEGREKLFTRFHRVRAVGQVKAAGLGLGLYIAKGLIEAHGGRIWVESEPERYATFRFTLPQT